jgi:hypothetical protein
LTTGAITDADPIALYADADPGRCFFFFPAIADADQTALYADAAIVEDEI